MNQEYRERVKRHLDAGGDSKYVNVKKKAEARHNSPISKVFKKEVGEKQKTPMDLERSDKIKRGISISKMIKNRDK